MTREQELLAIIDGLDHRIKLASEVLSRKSMKTLRPPMPGEKAKHPTRHKHDVAASYAREVAKWAEDLKAAGDELAGIWQERRGVGDDAA